MNRHFIDYNAIPAPYVAMSDPAKTPSQIADELKKAREAAQAEDAKAYANMKAPAAPAPRDPAYRPEGFDFQYHGPKGLSGEVIPKRPEPAALLVPEPKQAPAAAEVPEGATHRSQLMRSYFKREGDRGYWWCGWQWIESVCSFKQNDDTHRLEELPAKAAPTEWQSGPPPERGWYASSCSSTVDDTALASFWDGDLFTHYASLRNGSIGSVNDKGWTKVWRGPRLTGADWPEPSAS